MKYALLLMGHVNDPACGEEGGASPEEFFAFDQEITAAGVVVSSFALEDPDQAVTVGSNAQGERIVSSGPFAEVQEFVGGGYIIDVANIDEAIQWARKSPASAAGGHVEIRPVAPY
ncbi:MULTISPECIES: YciI family protein [Glutamicibacter]|uniref:YciI family protein n=1 Tax=Glutamicibacter sp. PS TaxID=3075634 RepID=UPI00283F344B|nr:YciI family protein [Glutamicibacter sp. PS]MDR4534717.1 YciI family protein [Glutamicibacter sp. PS]